MAEAWYVFLFFAVYLRGLSRVEALRSWSVPRDHGLEACKFAIIVLTTGNRYPHHWHRS